MLKVVVFKWYDPNGRHNHLFVYTSKYVNKLRSMLARHLTIPHELVCVTDDPQGIDEGITVLPFPDEMRDFRSLHRKLYAFHPDAAEIFGGERILMMDLDCVIVGSLDWLADETEPFKAWAGPPGNICHFNTSMVLMDAGFCPDIWNRFDPVESFGELRKAGYLEWDQDWVAHILGNKGPVWPRTGGAIISFTPHRLQPLPPTARVVFFNGRVAPGMKKCQQEAPWILDHWR